jgi:hypothetical protein
MNASGMIVPGDIIWMDGHVGIVCSVVFTGGNRNVTADKVTIIEAAGLGWRTRNDRKWADLSGVANCQIRRLASN